MWPAIIAGGAALLGGAMGNKSSKNESRRNRAFQERMRNTQWQAAVADMEAAGINPALAYSQGPAASPGGSMASQGDVVSPAISSAMQFKQMQKSLKLMDEQIDKTKAEKEIQQWQALWEKERANYFGLDDDVGIVGRGRLDPLAWKLFQAGLELTEGQASSARAAAAQAHNLSRITGVGADFAESGIGRLVPLLTLLGSGIGGASNIVRALGSLKKNPINIIRRR